MSLKLYQTESKFERKTAVVNHGEYGKLEDCLHGEVQNVSRLRQRLVNGITELCVTIFSINVAIFGYRRLAQSLENTCVELAIVENPTLFVVLISIMLLKI